MATMRCRYLQSPSTWMSRTSPALQLRVLTDHSADKKADVIYISEADGVVCVAQGHTAKNWGKEAAPSNKASDVNTAAAWLLRTPIADVPDRIRTQAQLLRDGLQKKTITKVIFAYAHNALDSQNVEKELKTVRHLLSGLDLVKHADVEVIELGLRRIEALYLTSLGSIQVKEPLTLAAHEVIRQKGPGWRSFVLSLNGAILYDLYERHKNAPFSANLRDFLGDTSGLEGCQSPSDTFQTNSNCTKPFDTRKRSPRRSALNNCLHWRMIHAYEKIQTGNIDAGDWRRERRREA
jgi:hypothetical protein